MLQTVNTHNDKESEIVSITSIDTVNNQYLRIDTQEIEATILYSKETDTFVVFVNKKVPADIICFHIVC